MSTKAFLSLLVFSSAGCGGVPDGKQTNTSDAITVINPPPSQPVTPTCSYGQCFNDSAGLYYGQAYPAVSAHSANNAAAISASSAVGVVGWLRSNAPSAIGVRAIAGGQNAVAVRAEENASTGSAVAFDAHSRSLSGVAGVFSNDTGAGVILAAQNDPSSGHDVFHVDANGSVYSNDVLVPQIGAQGAQGPIGPVGPQGNKGPTGDKGARGDPGPTAPAQLSVAVCAPGNSCIGVCQGSIASSHGSPCTATGVANQNDGCQFAGNNGICCVCQP